MSWMQYIPMALSAVSALSRPQASTSSVDKSPWGPQAEQLTHLFDSARGLYDAGGSLNPDASPDTLAAQNMMRTAAQGFGNFMQPYEQAQNFALNDVLSPESNPYLQKYMDAVTQSIMRGVTEQALPAIRGQAITAGGYGGSRQGIAEAQAVGRGAQQAGNAVSGLASQAYGQGLNTMNMALNRAPAFASLQFMPGQQMAGLGQSIEDYQRKAALDPWQRLSLYQNAIGGQSWGNNKVSTGATPGYNPLMQGIGGFMAGQQLMNMFPPTTTTTQTPIDYSAMTAVSPGVPTVSP